MKKPHFPTIIFLAAATLDLIIQPVIFALTFIVGITMIVPVVGTVSGAALMALSYLIGVFASALYLLVLIFWRFHKPKEVRKYDRARFALRLAFMFLVGIVPGVRLIFPENMAVVLLTHRREKKLWEQRASRRNILRAANDNRLARFVLQKAA